MTRRKWDAAVERAKAFLKSKQADPKVNVDIYVWEGKQQPAIGVRVAEVSFSTFDPTSQTGGGSSYMQVDVPWGAAVCLLTERLIIAYADAWPDDETREEEDRLLYAIKGE